MNLEKILASTMLPSLPQVAIRLLEITKDADSEIWEVVEAIKLDPAITAKVLKAANSSYFTFQSTVTSIERAVPMLGTNVVSSLVLSFSLVDAVSAKGPLAKHYQNYWLRSIAQAAAAETIGEITGAGIQCENFLAGLIMDIGRLAMLRAIDEELYLPVLEQSEIDSEHMLAELEKEQFGFDHTEVGAGLIEQWGLDVCLIDVARTHHQSLEELESLEPTSYSNLLKTTALASAVCDYLCGYQIALSLDRIRMFAESYFGFDEKALQSLIDQVRNRIDAVAAMFSVDASQIGDPQELIQLANEQLAEVAIRQQMVASEEASRQRQEFEEARLQLENQNNQLQEQAFVDTLTNIYNRRFFDICLQKEFDRCLRSNERVALVMIDVDHFKNLNDTCGHQFGDEVLVEVASALQQTVRGADVLARYGGEEFAIIAHSTTPEGLTVLSERLRRCIEILALDFEDRPIPVTISIGAAISRPLTEQPDLSPAKLIALADKLLYQSKENGRNRIYVNSYSPTVALECDVAPASPTIAQN